ncbi:DUF4232 domain-containing protein [Streptomyces sp. NPDC059398]|uniref:DUF4232 domain-containing protein n=1 Tax=Streptomyces sp. NPDC059398 TaxID=3346820 RepID=UPI0036BA317A
MRVKKISALALVVAAAGLSLTACGSSDGPSASAAHTNSSNSAGSSTGDKSTASGSSDSSSSGSSASGASASGSSASGSSAGSGNGGSGKGSNLTTKTQSATSAATCDADHLALSTASTGAKNEIVVNMKNTGPSACTMHGFPGVQLIGPDGLGDTGPDAARTDTSGSAVTIAHGEETRFLLHYIPDTSGSGKTYTRLDVTPPNERVSEIVNLGKLAITVSPSSGNAPDVYVDPIGYHTGSGK